MPIAAGKLDRRITLIRVTMVQDSTGQPVPTEAPPPHDTVWAQKMEQRVGEVFKAGADLRTDRVIFRIRWRSDVQQSWIVAYEGGRYEIVGMTEYGRREGLDLICERTGESV